MTTNSLSSWIFLHVVADEAGKYRRKYKSHGSVICIKPSQYTYCHPSPGSKERPRPNPSPPRVSPLPRILHTATKLISLTSRFITSLPASKTLNDSLPPIHWRKPKYNPKPRLAHYPIFIIQDCFFLIPPQKFSKAPTTLICSCPSNKQTNLHTWAGLQPPLIILPPTPHAIPSKVSPDPLLSLCSARCS